MACSEEGSREASMKGVMETTIFYRFYICFSYKMLQAMRHKNLRDLPSSQSSRVIVSLKITLLIVAMYSGSQPGLVKLGYFYFCMLPMSKTLCSLLRTKEERKGERGATTNDTVVALIGAVNPLLFSRVPFSALLTCSR